MGRIKLSSNDPSSCLIVSFHYDPVLIARAKTIDGCEWHPDKTHWSFPNKGNILEKILKVFWEEDVRIDSALRTATSKAREIPSPIVGERWGEGYDLEDLQRELASRKYSYKAIKGYLYYNKDFINHVQKNPSQIKMKTSLRITYDGHGSTNRAIGLGIFECFVLVVVIISLMISSLSTPSFWEASSSGNNRHSYCDRSIILADVIWSISGLSFKKVFPEKFFSHQVYPYCLCYYHFYRTIYPNDLGHNPTGRVSYFNENYA